ncbi:MAG: hypothetical protein JJU16_05110 [Alkalibacterium sp.]|nr:hypothetical protein [Alkalibacterium sp.]
MEILLNEAMVLAAVMAPVIAFFVQLIKSDINTRWLPYVSVGIGIGIGLIFAVALGEGLFLYGLAGFFSGAAASGLYDGVHSITKGGE